MSDDRHAKLLALIEKQATAGVEQKDMLVKLGEMFLKQGEITIKHNEIISDLMTTLKPSPKSSPA